MVSGLCGGCGGREEGVGQRAETSAGQGTFLGPEGDREIRHISSLTSVLKKNRRRGRGWTRALGPEQLLRACEAITVGKGASAGGSPVLSVH